MKKIREIIHHCVKGFKLVEFAPLMKCFNDLSSKLIALGADTSVGKTLFQCQLALDILKNNHDTSLLFMNLDDSIGTTWIRLLSNMTGVPPILVKQPDMIKQSEMREHLEKAIDILDQLQESKRLSVYSMETFFATDSTSDFRLEKRLTDLKSHIGRMSRENPKLVMSLDHGSNIYAMCRGDEAENASITFARLKSISNHYDMPIIGTFEVNKPKANGTTPQLKGGSKVLYAPDFVAYFTKAGGITHQTTKLTIEKNKINGVTGELTLEFDDSKTAFLISEDNLNISSIDQSNIQLRDISGYL
jgi:hypothetical protein